MATQTLMRSFGALSLSTTTRTLLAKPAAPAAQAIRTISTTLLSRPRASVAPSSFARNAVQAVTQQTRGMKVHSSVKKRCEHCKVGRYPDGFGGSRDKKADATDCTSQIVRRKAGKRSNGYLYVICKSNPRHKQRQS